MALIRYPGSKEKLANEIMAEFPDWVSLPLWMDSNLGEYREPFFGAGAIGFRVLECLPPSCTAWINDADYWLVCLWKAVQGDIERLCEKIRIYTPNVEDFYRFKEEYGKRDGDMMEIAFRKLALHQMSYSGLGPMAGGPLGGRRQESKLYTVDCRWAPELLMREAVRLHKILNRKNIRITCRDFSELIGDNPKIFLYLDPPYYEKGSVLYDLAMSENEHARLAQMLRHTQSRWVLSYDDHPRIRELYTWAEFKELEVTYTAAIANGPRRPKNQEVLISVDRISIETA